MDVSVSLPKMTTVAGSAFRWLRTGREAFAVMLEAVNAAQSSIRLETYIVRPGEVADQFRESLVQAVVRGVRVQVLVDAFGSLGLSASYWEPLTKVGGEFAWFNPLSPHRWSHRDHRKLLICDDVVGYIGGFNFADEYNGDGVEHGWRDLGLEVKGDVIQELAASFDAFFSNALMMKRQPRRFRRARDIPRSGSNWKLLFSGPRIKSGHLKRSLVADLDRARSVKIICAYFVPTWRLRKALMDVAKRGGDVQLILAGKSDVPLVQFAGRRLYSTFLRAGVKIYEFEPQILHSKLFLIDDVVYAGSSNLDTRSLRINYELLVRIENAPLAAEARDIFQKDQEHCRKIDRVTWSKTRTLWTKLREDWAYFIVVRVDPYLARRQLRGLRRLRELAASRAQAQPSERQLNA
jgi:cardiolipin synthase